MLGCAHMAAIDDTKRGDKRLKRAERELNRAQWPAAAEKRLVVSIQVAAASPFGPRLIGSSGILSVRLTVEGPASPTVRTYPFYHVEQPTSLQ